MRRRVESSPLAGFVTEETARAQKAAHPPQRLRARAAHSSRGRAVSPASRAQESPGALGAAVHTERRAGPGPRGEGQFAGRYGVLASPAPSQFSRGAAASPLPGFFREPSLCVFAVFPTPTPRAISSRSPLPGASAQPESRAHVPGMAGAVYRVQSLVCRAPWWM